ncbi:MAG: flavin reductase family protein [Actinomycetaceae bacterium]|nr:flavin reductase family protein [Actinomycetaceae bacterium]
MTPDALRRALSNFPTGIVLVTAQDDDGNPAGMLASSFTSVSLDPPLVSVAFARTSSTWPLLRRAPVLRISILSTEHHAIVSQLAGPSAQRFIGLECALHSDDASLLGSPVTLSVEPNAVIEAGDHDIALLKVRDIYQDQGLDPLVFYARGLHHLDI